MGTAAERRAARAQVAAYHQACLSELIDCLARTMDQFRAGELDAFETDTEIHRYHQAARRLWVFCDQSGAQVETTARLLERMAESGETIDWWQAGAVATDWR